MRITIINIMYKEEDSSFDQKALERFQEENDIEIIKAELIQKPEALLWSFVLSYTPRKKLLTPREFTIQEFLKKWRYEKAGKLGISSFVILNNKQLDEIVILKPTSKIELLKIKGFSEKKYQDYGEEIISMFTKEFIIQ